MQEFQINTNQWKSFWDRWQDTINHLPGLKEAMLEKIGGRVQEEVRTAVDRSGLNDARGRVKRWQNPHVGSGLGYVAVRADTSFFDCAVVTLTLALTPDRADFVGPDLYELMQNLEMQVRVKKENG